MSKDVQHDLLMWIFGPNISRHDQLTVADLFFFCIHLCFFLLLFVSVSFTLVILITVTMLQR